MPLSCKRSLTPKSALSGSKPSETAPIRCRLSRPKGDRSTRIGRAFRDLPDCEQATLCSLLGHRLILVGEIMAQHE